jgi:hypothetical protein
MGLHGVVATLHIPLSKIHETLTPLAILKGHKNDSKFLHILKTQDKTYATNY